MSRRPASHSRPDLQPSTRRPLCRRWFTSFREAPSWLARSRPSSGSAGSLHNSSSAIWYRRAVRVCGTTSLADLAGRSASRCSPQYCSSAADWPSAQFSLLAVMVLWTAYAFVSGIVAVPYNDIVARSVPSEMRSRLLATRFFGGGVLALGVAAIADRLVANLEFPVSYAGIFGMAACLMLISSERIHVHGRTGNRTRDHRQRQSQRSPTT